MNSLLLFQLLLLLEPLVSCPFGVPIEVLCGLVMRNKIFSSSKIDRNNKDLREDRESNFFLSSASFSNSNKGVDDCFVGCKVEVGDGKEGSNIVLIEMQIDASSLRINMSNIGQESSWQIIPICSSDSLINLVSDLATRSDKVGLAIYTLSRCGNMNQSKQQKNDNQLHLIDMFYLQLGSQIADKNQQKPSEKKKKVPICIIQLVITLVMIDLSIFNLQSRICQTYIIEKFTNQG